jgi:hypothetical protein
MSSETRVCMVVVIEIVAMVLLMVYFMRLGTMLVVLMTSCC